MRLSVAVAVACLSLVSLSFADDVKAATRKPTNIPAEGLGPALEALAKERGFQVAFVADDVAGLLTQGASGDLTPQEALTQLLRGTGLTYRFYDDNAVSIVPVSRGAAPPEPAAPNATSSTGQRSDSLAGKEDDQKHSFWERFRLAQADQATAGPQVAQSTTKEEQPTQLQEVVVTGTYLKGVQPVSPVIEITREDIEASGYPTVGTYLQSLPQNFAGSINPSSVGNAGGIAAGGRNAISQSSTADLHGLGWNSTLTLVDGHRLSYDGSIESVDLSIIPTVAVQRMEVTTDGASAIYGSDAVAGVVNVLLRKDYEGADTTVTVGGTQRGGGSQQQYSQIFGKNFEQGNAVIAYEYARTEPLLASQRDISSAALSPLDLLPEQKRNSVFGAGSFHPSSDLTARLEGVYAQKDHQTIENEVDNTYTFFGGTHQYGVDGGLDYALPHDGVISLDVNAAGNNQDFSQRYFGGSSGNTLDSRIRSAELKVQPPVLDIPTGQVRFAVGGGYRRESLDTTATDSSSNSYDRGISYAFGEFNVPLVEKSSSRIGLASLDLDASVRHERYSQIGDTTNPKVGIVYTPIQDLSLRASWGTSFRAPSLSELHVAPYSYLYPGSIFLPPVPATSTVLLYAGASPSLHSEHARTWSTSLEYEPERPGLSATLTYYQITYSDRIVVPLDNIPSAVANPVYSSFVTLNPTPQLQQSYISRGPFYNLVPYDPNNVYALLLDEYTNAEAQRIDGVDALLSYRWQSRWGDWAASANASWLNFVQYLVPGVPQQRVSGTVFNPPSFKGRASLTWSNGGWSAVAFLNYVSAETNNLSTPNVRIAAWDTVDGTFGYSWPNSSGFWHGLALRASVQNVFDRVPPGIASSITFPPGVGFDASNASPVGRAGSLTVSKAW